MRPAMTHERAPADIPPRLAMLVKIALGIATTALTGTVGVAYHCLSHAA